MHLKKKISFGYLVVIVMMILSGIFGIASVVEMGNTMDTYIDKVQRADNAVNMCRINTNIAARIIREMALNDDTATYADYKAEVEKKMEDLDVYLQELKGTGVIDTTLYQKYESALNGWGTIGYSILAELEAGDREGATELILTKCAPALDEAIVIANEINNVTEQEEATDVLRMKWIIGFCVGMIILFLIISVCLAVRIGSLVLSAVLTPVQKIEEMAKELSQGNLQHTLEYNSNDELGALAHSLRSAVETLSSYVGDISCAMQKFSSGNFDAEPSVEWKGDFIGILDSFMIFEGSMSDMVKGIQEVANEVASGSEQVSLSSGDLAQGATDQAAVTQELTATINSVAERVAQNADNAKEISQKVDTLGGEIISSNEKMQEMVKSMEEINQASTKISNIIATINDIAAQTNLLALNASIEAARAGDAGKGFAVVADQVSVLASQSADAAKESTALIQSSVRAVGKGMVVATETAQELETVVNNSRTITGEVTEVAKELEEQTQAIQQINEGVEHINEVVQSNSATSQECAAASEEMSSQAEVLNDLIGRFKVK
ncbi:MAG: methyl-accepting chemotaxis protein [Lachnospiraceae bacterium]|nr:methyl-accepting chemotaxis protein [Lachnospiraceae bacterium]